MAAPPPMLPDATRDNGKSTGRDFFRRRPRDPHEIFNIEDHLKKKGMDYVWVAPQIMGQPNRRFTDFLSTGWTLAEAKDFPEHAGLNVAKIDPRLIEYGYLKEIRSDGPVEQKGMLLLTRPEQMSDDAREEEQQRADGQIDGHLRRLRFSSERAIGKKTEISRRTTRGAAPPDMVVPDDADLEE